MTLTTSPNINKEKLKSINFWMRHCHLFKVDEEWQVDQIKCIVDSKDWHCLKEHQDDGLMHERQLAYLINETGYVPDMYTGKDGESK